MHKHYTVVVCTTTVDPAATGSPAKPPPGNASALAAEYYYTTTLGKYSGEELVARQAVQTLLGLFANRGIYLNFSQQVDYDPGNDTITRYVRGYGARAVHHPCADPLFLPRRSMSMGM